VNQTVLLDPDLFSTRNDFVGRAPWPAVDALVGLPERRLPIGWSYAALYYYTLISSPGTKIWWDRRFRLSLRQKALWGGRSCRLPTMSGRAIDKLSA
jgi:hypothetical protein